MSAVLELTETSVKNETDGNISNGVKPFHINVEIYHSMIENGILTANDKVELINGEIFEKYTNGEKYRFTTEVYDLMIKHGILTENDNVELLDGEIIRKMPKGPKHCYLNDLIRDLLKEKLGQNAYIRIQNSFLLENSSEPEPDILVCKPPRELYSEKLPTAADVFLAIEISDTTLYVDRNKKEKIYSRAGIRQYIIVNVLNNTIEDYRQPSSDGFQVMQTYKIGDVFNLVAFPEIEIKVTDFFQN